MEKESNRGLRLQVRPDLSCSVTHARLPHQRAPQRTRGSLFLVSAGRDPNHLFPSSPGGEAFFNACLLRRTHQAARLSNHARQASLPSRPILTQRAAQFCQPWAQDAHPLKSWVRVSGCDCAQGRGQGSQPLVIYYLLSHTPRRLPHHAHHPASCKVAPLFPTLPARQEGPGPPLFSQVAFLEAAQDCQS